MSLEDLHQGSRVVSLPRWGRSHWRWWGPPPTSFWERSPEGRSKRPRDTVHYCSRDERKGTPSTWQEWKFPVVSTRLSTTLRSLETKLHRHQPCLVEIEPTRFQKMGGPSTEKGIYHLRWPVYRGSTWRDVSGLSLTGECKTWYSKNEWNGIGIGRRTQLVLPGSVVRVTTGWSSGTPRLDSPATTTSPSSWRKEIKEGFRVFSFHDCSLTRVPETSSL